MKQLLLTLTIISLVIALISALTWYQSQGLPAANGHLPAVPTQQQSDAAWSWRHSQERLR